MVNEEKLVDLPSLGRMNLRDVVTNWRNLGCRGNAPMERPFGTKAKE
jgi:hypothetical protein